MTVTSVARDNHLTTQSNSRQSAQVNQISNRDKNASHISTTSKLYTPTVLNADANLKDLDHFIKQN